MKSELRTYPDESPYGVVQLMTRFCPDHPGVMVARIGEGKYQCPLDGKIYDYQTGFVRYDGRIQYPSSLSNQTLDEENSYISSNELPSIDVREIKGSKKEERTNNNILDPKCFTTNRLEEEAVRGLTKAIIQDLLKVMDTEVFASALNSSKNVAHLFLATGNAIKASKVDDNAISNLYDYMKLWIKSKAFNIKEKNIMRERRKNYYGHTTEQYSTCPYHRGYRLIPQVKEGKIVYICPVDGTMFIFNDEQESSIAGQTDINTVTNRPDSLFGVEPISSIRTDVTTDTGKEPTINTNIIVVEGKDV